MSQTTGTGHGIAAGNFSICTRQIQQVAFWPWPHRFSCASDRLVGVRCSFSARKALGPQRHAQDEIQQENGSPRTIQDQIGSNMGNIIWNSQLIFQSYAGCSSSQNFNAPAECFGLGPTRVWDLLGLGVFMTSIWATAKQSDYPKPLSRLLKSSRLWCTDLVAPNNCFFRVQETSGAPPNFERLWSPISWAGVKATSAWVKPSKKKKLLFEYLCDICALHMLNILFEFIWSVLPSIIFNSLPACWFLDQKNHTPRVGGIAYPP